MAKIGYARVSSKTQNLERQLEQLKNCERIFSDVESGVKERQGLNNLISYIREGDIVVVTELNRLGRNNKEITSNMEIIKSKKVTIEILDFPSFYGIEDDNLRKLLNQIILEVILYQAENERKNIKELQRQGIELAKKQGKYKGRKRLFNADDPRLLHAMKLHESGMTLKDVSKTTGINVSTLYRYIKKY